MISYNEIQELTKEYQDEVTRLNIPDDIDPNIFTVYKDLIKKAYEDPTRRCVVLGPSGHTVWEESDTDYQGRMSNLFHEVK